jgi:hypothetical protein
VKRVAKEHDLRAFADISHTIADPISSVPTSFIERADFGNVIIRHYPPEIAEFFLDKLSNLFVILMNVEIVVRSLPFL